MMLSGLLVVSSRGGGWLLQLTSMHDSDSRIGNELHGVENFKAHLRQQLCTSAALDKHVLRTRHIGALGMIDAVYPRVAQAESS